jgi:hypothetical protein
MPKLLELAEFTHGDGMPEMKIGGGRVVAAINAQRFASFFSFNQAFAQLNSHVVGYGFITKIGTLH